MFFSRVLADERLVGIRQIRQVRNSARVSLVSSSTTNANGETKAEYG
jgi:hypothetical protein